MRVSHRPIAAAITALTFLAACEPANDAPTKAIVEPEGADASAMAAPAPDAAGEARTGTAHEAPGRLEAHVHGTATLAIALDGDQLTFSFEAPLMSMAGFEHEPDTDAETETVNALKDTFVVPGNMVSVNRSAGCLPLMTTSGTHISGGHGALEVEHVYTCETPDEISTIDFLMMSDYPALEEIDAVFVSDTDQVAATLTPDNFTLQVR